MSIQGQHRGANGTRTFTRFLGVIGIIAALAAVPAVAQIEGATLRGTVAEEAGPNVGVEITVRDVERGYTSKTTTRADGSYIFVGLRPGTYEVSVGDSSELITLRVGQTASLDFETAASLETMDEIVVVGTKIESFSGGEIGTNITPELIERLPQTDRNFLTFADLAPGVQVNRNANGSIHIRGGAQNINKVNVFLDGVSQKDYVLKGGITGQDTSRGNPFPQAAVGEYKVITQNYKAEYEHVSSAAITAVTKSGTNEFQGDLFYDFTDEDLRHTEPNEEDGKTPSSTEQYGVTLSGPIIRDKLHFLASYEGKEFETPFDVTGGDDIGNVTLPPEYQALLGTFPGKFDEDLFFGKLNWWINDAHSMEASVKLRDEASFSFGGQNTESYAGKPQVEEQRFNVKHTFSATRFQNEIRLTTEDVEWLQEPARFENAQVLELANNRRVILRTGGNAGYQTKGQKGWSIQNDFTWFDLEWNGNHVIKTGIKYREIDLEILQQNSFNPQYHYNVEVNGPGTFTIDQPYRVRWFVPASGSDVGGAFVSEQKHYGLYIQDDWDVNDRLTLNIGIRWDYEDNPTYTDYVTPANLVATLEGWPNIQDTDYDYRDYISTGNNRDNFKDAWAPRFGFSYAMDEAGGHTLFGGYGRSYDRNQFDLIKNEVLRGTFATAEFRFTGDPDYPCDPMTDTMCLDWDPVYLTREGLDGLVTDIAVLDEAHLLPNDLKVPYSDQLSIGVRSNWGNYWSTEVSFSYVESHDQFSWYLGNRREDGAFFAPGTIFGQPWGFGLPDRNRHLIIGRNDGETETDSVYIKVGRAHLINWGFDVAYTYTDATENRLVSGSFNLAYPTVDGYTGYAVVDVPKHRLVATGTFDLPWDILASAKFTYRSSLNKQFLSEANGGGGQRFFDRIEPDDGDFQSLDLSVSKSFATPLLMDGSEVWVRFDVINVFNRKNYRNFILGFNNPLFGEPNPNSSTFGLRSLKLSAGWRF